MNARVSALGARAATYARFSSEMQKATSIEDQERKIRRVADAEGWNIVARFADKAISGSDASRPEYQRMLAAARRGEFEILIVDDFSRIARDSIEQETVLRELEFEGLRIVSVDDSYDTARGDEDSRKFQRQVKATMNEMYLGDLRKKTHRGIEGQAHRGFWTGGRPYGYRLRPVLDESRRDQYGQPMRVGSRLEIEPAQAKVVRYIFAQFADGQSYRAIAAALNKDNVPSPGSTWNRKVRRCAGWMGSAIRSIIFGTEIYGGLVRWNANKYVKNPRTGKIVCRARPQKDWFERRDEALRIVDDQLIHKARTRVRTGRGGKTSPDDERLKSGGKPRFLLSGLLRCGCCNANYIMANAHSYACSSFRDGDSCKNGIHVRRDVAEREILDPIREDLLAPERVERMAAEMQAAYLGHIQQTTARAEAQPRALQDLDARIERLRERLKNGDPDMAPDELEAAIERALAKRRELEAARPEARKSATILAALPKAAALYRKQIASGLDGDPRESLKARVILRELFGGQIMLEPGEGGSLWANFEMRPAVLLRGVGTGGGP